MTLEARYQTLELPFRNLFRVLCEVGRVLLHEELMESRRMWSEELLALDQVNVLFGLL
jgi:hypothetical protein